MNNLEAINKRISRRKYLKTPISEEKIAIIKSKINEINEINKESELVIEFLEDGSRAFKGIKNSYGMFSGVKSIIVLKSNNSATDTHFKEKIGYYGEVLVLEATKLDLGTCWVGGTFNKKDPLFKDINDDFICIITIGNVKEDKSIKEKIIRKMTHIRTKNLESFYNSEDTEENFPEWFINGIIGVSKAPTAINRRKFRFNYNDGKVTATIPDNYVFDLVDLGIGKLHFEIASGTNRKFEFGNPGILLD
ncbi:MAG: nitroreductase family protein [Methanobacteriaceae archaeon]